MKRSRNTRRVKKGGNWFGNKSSPVNNFKGHLNKLRQSGNLPTTSVNPVVNNSRKNVAINTPKQSVANTRRRIGNNYENKFMKPALRPRKVVKRPAWVNIVPNEELKKSWEGTAKGSE